MYTHEELISIAAIAVKIARDSNCSTESAVNDAIEIYKEVLEIRKNSEEICIP